MCGAQLPVRRPSLLGLLPTYLPAIATLIADDKGGHGLVRAAGLHLGEAQPVLSHPWGC